MKPIRALVEHVQREVDLGARVKGECGHLRNPEPLCVSNGVAWPEHKDAERQLYHGAGRYQLAARVSAPFCAEDRQVVHVTGVHSRGAPAVQRRRGRPGKAVG